MTDEETRDLGKKIDRLSDAVHEGQKEVAKSIGELTATVKGLSDQHSRLEDRVDKITSEQAGCPGRAGVKGVNARLRRIEDRIDPKPGGQPAGQPARGDDSGLADMAAERAIAEAERAAGRAAFASRSPALIGMLSLIRPILPWIVAALIGLGVYLGTGGDKDATSAAILDFTERLIQIEKTVKPIVEERDDVAAGSTACATAWGPTSGGPTSDPRAAGTEDR